MQGIPLLNSHIAIGIIEDDNLLLSNYTQYFSIQENYLLSFGYKSFEEFTSSFTDELVTPDIILLDIKLPGISGIDCIDELKSKFPNCKVIMLSAFEDEKTILQALQNGAAGYLMKSMSLFQINDIISNTQNGIVPISNQATQTLLNYIYVNKINVNTQVLCDLTIREKEIALCLSDGLTYKQAAQQLHISSNTINQHLKKIYLKLHINSKSELISKILK